MTLVKLVILHPSPVILNEAKNPRAGSVKDLWETDPLPGWTFPWKNAESVLY
jgi:hypothetical protein